MSTGKELVGPLPTISFHGDSPHRRVRMAFTVPRDTLDPRYMRCTDHHPACDCREAEHAEYVDELCGELTMIEREAARLLVGHRLYDHGGQVTPWDVAAGTVDEDTYRRYSRGDGPLACQCTGCRIVRAAQVWIWTDVHGVVTPDAVERIR